jgi:hypothetical protein
MAEAAHHITIEEFKEKVKKELNIILKSPQNMTEDLKTCLKNDRDYHDVTLITEETLNINPSDIKLVGSVALILQAIFVLETKKEKLGKKFEDLKELVNKYIPLVDDYDIVVSENYDMIIDNYIKLKCKGFIKYNVNNDIVPQIEIMENGIKMIYEQSKPPIKIDYIGTLGLNPKRIREDTPDDGSLVEYTIDDDNIINLAKVNELGQDYGHIHRRLNNTNKIKQKNHIKLEIYKILYNIYSHVQDSSMGVLNFRNDGSPPAKRSFGNVVVGGYKRKQTKKKTSKNNIKKIQKRSKKWACSSCGWSPRK